MPKKITERERILKEIVDDLTIELKELRSDAINCATIILKKEMSVSKLNGIIGGKNNTYVDSVRTQFLDFNDFFAQWIKGLIDAYEMDKAQRPILLYKDYWLGKASFRNIRLLQDSVIFNYTQKLLERNFYKYLDERLRSKPNETLWSIWFGYKLIYGLLIAPVKRFGSWTNDKSEIRKAKYNYWTIGHIMETGLIDPDHNPIRFYQVDDFFNFYLSVIKRISNSAYEQKICDRYVEYLNESSKVLDEPFLIPEFRYAGLEREHLYRLDFTVLNQQTEEFVGFEISPSSSHMVINNLKQKQSSVNIELKEKWENEMKKRNSYFNTFGITTLTFTDSDLVDIDNCFKLIKKYLADRPQEKISLNGQIQRLNNYTIQ